MLYACPAGSEFYSIYNTHSTNVNPPTVSQDRTWPPLNNSGHCLESRTGSRSGVEETTTSAMVIKLNISKYKKAVFN